MVDDISTVVSGVITAITSIINPLSGQTNTAAYAAIFALPILGGTVAFARRLIKKSR